VKDGIEVGHMRDEPLHLGLPQVTHEATAREGRSTP
jgi:hypothetical protein